MRRPSPAELYGEMAEIAQTFHWGRDSVLDLDHRERRLWVAEAAALRAGA
jgi:hypothetical protein